ncbi:DNA cytosine methyltransferase [Rhodococcus sp. RS1C4]|nr:DNA cytosine methyltransferase [Rhodococcus sp. RS1C4]OZC49408.1 DNA cytosine methyltransferase [Rhodococcus sp. RS1C4]
MEDSRASNIDLSSHSVIDLFAGPGGIDVAATWLGMQSHGIEWDDDACATRRQAGLNTTQGDVRKLGPADFPAATVLAGGPPCQTFTVAGPGSGRESLDHIIELIAYLAEFEDITQQLTKLSDERTGLVLEPLRWVRDAVAANRPFEAVVLEQVQTVLPVWEAMKPALESFGYEVECAVLRTEQFGVPQTRRRAVLVANRVTTPIRPMATHQSYSAGMRRGSGKPDLDAWETMGTALNRSGWFEVVSNYGSGGISTARGRRTSDQPAATVTGKVSRNRILDRRGVEQNRFTRHEAGRLQTFPADYPWFESAWAQQVGNAMPPRLAVHALAAAFGLVPSRSQLDTKVSDKWMTRGNVSSPVELVKPRDALDVQLEQDIVAAV